MLYRYASAGVQNTTAGWRAWRIKVRYPGAYMLHCHILQHMIMGKLDLLGVANDIAKCIFRNVNSLGFRKRK